MPSTVCVCTTALSAARGRQLWLQWRHHAFLREPCSSSAGSCRSAAAAARVALASGDQRSVLLERLEPEAEYLVRVFASPGAATRANHTDAPVGLVRFVAPGSATAGNGSGGGVAATGGRGVPAVATATRPVVRDEEIVIVVLVLSVWLAVILLFFNKWGKIRMLEPYQPQYQEQDPPSPPVLQVKSVVLERELRRLSSNANGGGAAALQRLQRLRHNSVFVGSQILVPLSRRVKSAEDIKSMVLQIEHQASTQSTAL
ncbi:hypothetical protein V5799_023881 [Amblyomma americanum]|uniref:Fibronectin type III domain-containing protein n=1 Tax=Amblyomma americanum TaxID=6943 RepID=A0AAQ4FID0_AMBAM